MLNELVQLKHDHSPKFASTFNFLYKVIAEVEDHLRDMHCWAVPFPSIQDCHLSERYDGTYYRPHLGISLNIGDAGTAYLEVMENAEGFELELELICNGFAVCGSVDSFRLACAFLMIT